MHRLLKSKAFESLRQGFEARSTRERIIIILLAVVSVWASAQLLYFDPGAKREKLIQQGIKDARSQITQLKTKEQVLKIELAVGTLATLQAKRTELEQRLAELDAQLRQQRLGLIDAERMREVLHDLLQGANLDLVALRRLPPQVAFSTATEQSNQNSEAAVQKAQEGSGKQQTITLYRHPVQIELEGRYADMVHYLERLEASPWGLMWQELDIETVDYPRARMLLTVYTLSLQEEWLGV